FTVYLDSSAVVSIQRDGKDVVSQLGLGVFGQGRFRSLNRDYVPSEESRTKTRSESRGTFLATGSFEGGDYSLVAETTERGLKIAGQIASQDAAIRLGLAIDPTLGLVTVADGVAQRHLEDFEREGVTELVLGSGYRGMRIAFSEPTPVALLTDGGLSRVLLPLVAEGAERGFELQIQLDFAAEAGELTDLNTRASRAQVVDQNFGEAMRLYEEIVNRFSFRQDIADRAAEQLEVLRKAGEAKAELLSARADEMIFFKTFRTELSGLQRDVEQVATRYEGTTIAESLHQILDRARSAWEALAADERMELARNHLLRGQDLMRPGHVSPEAARAFFLSVQDLAPEGSELHDAAKSELARVASILGAN
ncbi:MAG: hypothetical protein KDB53_10755, partial [Planctomycetes bacterium]|nr:hypothetical protein [Planctomycetota bacterium]